MNGEDDAQEKSHEATQRRIDQARERGDVAQSQDAQAAVAYLGFALAAALAAGWSSTRLGEALMPLLAHPADLARQALSGGGRDLVSGLAREAGAAALPFLLLPGALVLALLVGLRRVIVAPDKIVPKLSRISPLANAKQKYGPHGLVEFLKSAVKLAAVAAVLWLALSGEAERLAGYTRIEARLMGGLLEAQLWSVLTGVTVVAVAIGLADALWQQHRHLGQLRMSHEEMKEESKESEGDPHIRASRRQRARDIATNRMLADVPKADVVITNPTHYAVALSWTRAPGAAPVCVAKGVDEIAAVIRQRAAEAGVPIHPDPSTARALHAVVGIGEEIRPEHFRAVAAAIVFADEMRRRGRGADVAPRARADEDGGRR
ncbi:EscU/YscU/HrcU family type III secretion system export apparatus switch protein [Limibaculum sp. FT325]|uniref:EscU/YscU/HrcU family type III secretion system export apparatus switch protein n=1 Tax=Thermohalobaculum sediminis TaxID=2939436 RepID=UPI0020C1552B|nr:EscU/YscU/HrcU family type III secretion system export apparatus switch protein [Limibaculum sediminis]MCL5778901.1 EscU/YscU/HrcU family type III secretion system export apparatus switch protein [Limibaculum sediminis]